MNIEKAKLLVVGCYHPLHEMTSIISAILLDSLNSNYEKFLLIGDLNSKDQKLKFLVS